MLKGKMKIELTDVNTGKVEEVVEENMVTDALSKIFEPLGFAKNGSNVLREFAPYTEKLLGGLFLFDKELEEESSNIYPPADAKMVGCASHGEQNNTTGTARGGYNQVESELNLKDRYMKYVYDFTTSQANGQIASVCLTHKNAGFSSLGYHNAVPYENYNFRIGLRVCDGTLQYVHRDYTGADTRDRYSGITVGESETLFLLDYETDSAYYFKIVDETSIDIIRRRAYLKSVSVLENSYREKPIIDKVELRGLETELFTSYIAYNFDHADNSLYIFSSSDYYFEHNDVILVNKVDVDTMAITQYELTNTSDVKMYANGSNFAYHHNGYVYFKSYDSPHSIYKFELGNSANVEKLENIGFESVDAYPSLSYNGRIYYENYSSHLYIANEHTNEILRAETRTIHSSSNYIYTFTPMKNNPMHYFVSLGNKYTVGFILLSNYLATINNLSEPVLKTADKTMKITYIIQEQ